MIKGVIFDLDGTLVDVPVEYIRKIVHKVSGEDFDQNALIEFWYGVKNRDEIIINSFGIDDVEHFWNSFHENDIVPERIKQTVVYPEVHEIIKKLHEMNIKIGIVTGSVSKNANASINLIGKHFFDHIISTHEFGLRHKPYPDGIKYCVDVMGLLNDEILFVGNGLEDLFAGRNAKIKTKIVRRQNQLQDMDSSVMINNLHEIFELLN
jgi:HAD superfamily hydrolase (TIGR01549 family)